MSACGLQESFQVTLTDPTGGVRSPGPHQFSMNGPDRLMTNDAMPQAHGAQMIRRETGGAPDARRDEGRQGRGGDSMEHHECKRVWLLSAS